MVLREKFASRLLALRKQAGISVAALGDALGISGASVTQLEKCQRSPSVEVFGKIADIFGVSYDYLAGCYGAPSPKETDTLYLEISALAPSDREEVMRYARYVRANPRK